MGGWLSVRGMKSDERKEGSLGGRLARCPTERVRERDGYFFFFILFRGCKIRGCIFLPTYSFHLPIYPYTHSHPFCSNRFHACLTLVCLLALRYMELGAWATCHSVFGSVLAL